MKTFSQLIAVEEGKLFFTFSPLQAAGDLQFYVRVVDSAGNAHFFHMKRKMEHWKIVDAPQVPAWIHAIEDTLHIVIEKNR